MRVTPAGRDRIAWQMTTACLIVQLRHSSF
ncbi:hypothetical protein FRAAL2817 [Frankia alni ACN14a]|uniref:Uncharacterized protein n=1 Tax=Frankia alni (strain DSM 45986 / CECT 9034 / ACN14a) TaxID=326424 RepID=Q0RLZ2_FRAAA|nr:hypothetical protein FRAAL2817 [Frankia alni ACN14a]